MSAYSQRQILLAHEARPVSSGTIAGRRVGMARTDALRFTERAFLCVLAIAYLISVSMPVFGIRLSLSFLNHFPLVLMCPVLLVQIMAMMVNRDAPRWAKAFEASWPLVLLALFAMIGSAFAKWLYEVDDTYLAFGIYLAIMPVYVALTLAESRVEKWASALMSMAIFFSILSVIGAAARFGTLEILHEIEYLVVAGLVALYFCSASRIVKLLSVVLIVAGAALNQKLTGYLCASLGLLYIFIISSWDTIAAGWRGLYKIGLVFIVAFIIAALALVYVEFREYLPSGNANVRLSQYEQAWRGFVDSPFWGAAYLTGSGEMFREAGRSLNIPTHSDVLDILKHGGLIGIGLFAFGYWKIVSLTHRAVAATQAKRKLHAYFLGAQFFQLTALLTFSFNPLLLRGPYLIVIWANLGLSAGLSMAVLMRSRSAAAR